MHTTVSTHALIGYTVAAGMCGVFLGLSFSHVSAGSLSASVLSEEVLLEEASTVKNENVISSGMNALNTTLPGLGNGLAGAAVGGLAGGAIGGDMEGAALGALAGGVGGVALSAMDTEMIELPGLPAMPKAEYDALMADYGISPIAPEVSGPLPELSAEDIAANRLASTGLSTDEVMQKIPSLNPVSGLNDMLPGLGDGLAGAAVGGLAGGLIGGDMEGAALGAAAGAMGGMAIGEGNIMSDGMNALNTTLPGLGDGLAGAAVGGLAGGAIGGDAKGAAIGAAVGAVGSMAMSEGNIVSNGIDALTEETNVDDAKNTLDLSASVLRANIDL